MGSGWGDIDSAGIAISTAPGDQRWPEVAFDGTNYLVAWTDSRSGASDIYGARVGPAGVVLDSTGVPISTAPGGQYVPSVAFDGTAYIVVWQTYYAEEYDVYGAIVDTSGAVLDPADIPVSTDWWNQTYPAVAAGPAAGVLVAYQSFIPPPLYGAERIWGNTWQLAAIPEGRREFKNRVFRISPNPSDRSCVIRYEVAEPGRVTLQVFDVTGALVRTLVSAHREAGMQNENWDGRTDDGDRLASGVYFCRLEAGDSESVRKIVLTR